MKDWWKKRKDKKAAKKSAKAEAKAETAAVNQLGSTGVMTQPLMSGAPTPLGSDTANRVYKTENKQNQAFGNGETTGYFKPDQSMAPAKNAVAASRVAKGLGMDDIIPETRFASLDTGNGLETGALSANAQGEALHSNVFDTDVTDKKGANFDIENATLPDHQKRKGNRVMELTGTEMNDIDLSRPNTQSGLNRLQWFDALTGNMDRHGANILVDPKSGNVSGIDNDLSFDRGVQSSWGEGFTGGAGHFVGLPDMIDEDTAERLLALDDAKIKELLQTDNKAAGLGKTAAMTDKDVKETVNRLKLIQAKVKAIKSDVTGGNLVKQWDQSTYDKQLNMAKHKDGNRLVEPNYIARHAAFMDEAKDASKPLMWRKGNRDADTTPQAPSQVPSLNASEGSEDEKDENQSPNGGIQSDEGKADETGEVQQVQEVVGQKMSADDAMQMLDELIAELDALKVGANEQKDQEQEGNEVQGQEDEKDLGIPSGGMPPLPALPQQRPSVPNASSNSTGEDEKQPVGGPRARRKARPRGMRLQPGEKLGL